MEHSALIEKLGGPHALRAALFERGINRTNVAVRAWALPGRGIPAKYWQHVIAIADGKGIEVDPASLADAIAAPTQAAA